MTQNYGVEQKRPSAFPRMLVGGAVGAGAGFALSKVDALKAPKFNSWSDVISSYSDDVDFKNAIEKAGDNTEVKSIYEKMKNAVLEYKDKVGGTKGESVVIAKLNRKQVFNNTVAEVTEKEVETVGATEWTSNRYNKNEKPKDR